MREAEAVEKVRRHSSRGQVDRQGPLEVLWDEGTETTEALEEAVAFGQGLGSIHESARGEHRLSVETASDGIDAPLGGGQVASENFGGDGAECEAVASFFECILWHCLSNPSLGGGSIGTGAERVRLDLECLHDSSPCSAGGACCGLCFGGSQAEAFLQSGQVAADRLVGRARQSAPLDERQKPTRGRIGYRVGG